MGYIIMLGFKKFDDAKLLAYAKNVVAKTLGVPRYAAENAQVVLVETATTDFQTAVQNASTGDRVLISIRRDKRLVLTNELGLLAMKLELHTDEDESFFIGAGFEVRSKPQKHLLPLPAPSLKYVRQGTMSGFVDGEATDFPPSVTQIAIEYSSDGGLSWNNGTYSTGKRFRLENLAPRAEYKLRVSYQGTRQRMSDWSEPMGIFVL